MKNNEEEFWRRVVRISLLQDRDRTLRRILVTSFISGLFPAPAAADSACTSRPIYISCIRLSARNRAPRRPDKNYTRSYRGRASSNFGRYHIVRYTREMTVGITTLRKSSHTIIVTAWSYKQDTVSKRINHFYRGKKERVYTTIVLSRLLCTRKKCDYFFPSLISHAYSVISLHRQVQFYIYCTFWKDSKWNWK